MAVEMGSVLENFMQWCKLPNMHRTVHDTHIIILKSIASFLEDYYYHKLGIYSIVVQVVDCNKRFFDICGGLLGNVNEFKILLCIIVLNIKICLILAKFWRVFLHICWADKAYPLIIWIMMPFK